MLLLLLVLSTVGSALAAQVPDPPATADPGVTVDFQSVDLRFVLSALAEAGNLNLIYGDLPARRITLRLARPVPRAELLPLIRNLAVSHGLQLVEENGLVRVEAGGLAAAQADQEAAGDLRLFVHRLRHAQAERLAATLQSLFGGATAGRAPSIGRSRLSETLRQQRIQPFGADSVLPTVQQGLPGLSAVLQGNVQIVPDELTNSLLVRASVADWEVIRQAIESLDLRPLQVLIEALIVEVRRTDEFDLSVSASGTDRGRRPVDPGVIGSLEGTEVGGLSLEIVRVGELDLNVVLTALASRGDVRIVSRPVITAQNNQEAHILVGTERPFVQVFRTLPTDNSARDQIIQYRDVGTSLTVKPTINADGYVNLEVSQEVSSATSEQQFGAPVISTREASTLLYVRDGETAVIGGLIDRQQERSRGGVPYLKDIPLLGALFGSTRRADLHSELFLFLTPHIMLDDDDMERVRQGVQEGTRRLPDQLPRLPIPPVEPVEIPPADSSAVRPPRGRP